MTATRPRCMCHEREGVRCDAAGCDLVDAGRPYDPAKHCRYCWNYWHSKEHNRGWGGDGKVHKVLGVYKNPKRPPCLCDGRDKDILCTDEHCDLASPEGAPGDANRCTVCHKWFHSPDHRAAWGGTPLTGQQQKTASKYLARLKTPCVHLGELTGESKQCTLCGNATIPLRSCAVHGVCTSEKLLHYKEDGRTVVVPWCVSCKDYEAPKSPCIHQREATGETADHSGKGATIPLPVHRCVKHSRCVRGHDAPHVHGCLDCPDYDDPKVIPDAGAVRHLLFHLYPLRDGGVWRWHAEQLRRHVGLFNGRRILALALDRHTEDAARVKEAYASLFDEILEFPNDPKLREVATFEALFSRVQSFDPQECFLWAHGKGASRHGHPCVRRWTELLYEMNLERWEDVRALLTRHPVVGSFKKVGAGWPAKESLSDWHYSGSWAWYRSRDLFGQADWRKIDRFWSGIEAYPSLHFTAEQAGCLFFEFPVDPQKQLYQEAFWRQTVEPAYEAWKASKTPRVDGLKVEIGGGEHPRGEGFLDVDRSTGFDLEKDRLPFEDDSVAEVYSAHAFEHITNLHHLLHEIVRVCKAGAVVTVIVPHWLSPMALCHDHKQVIPPEQVKHWCKTALAYWWKGCTKRLRHVRTESAPGGDFAEAKRLHPGWSDEQLMRFVPGAAHEVRYTLQVIAHDAATVDH